MNIITTTDNHDPHHWQYWASQISATWQKATETIIETGRLLIEAKAELDHGEFQKMNLPFGPRMAEMLMKVARHPVLSNPNHGSHLPASGRTLAELATLPPETVLARIEDGTINAGMQRKDVARLKPGLHPDPAAKHKARMAPIDRLKEENEEHLRKIADLEERLTSAEAGTVSVWEALDDEAGTAEHIAHLIILAAGEDKAKEIAGAILQRFKKPRGRPAKQDKAKTAGRTSS